MNAADAISTVDLDHADHVPTEGCPDCGGEMTRGSDCCPACERKRIEFEENERFARV